MNVLREYLPFVIFTVFVSVIYVIHLKIEIWDWKNKYSELKKEKEKNYDKLTEEFIDLKQKLNRSNQILNNETSSKQKKILELKQRLEIKQNEIDKIKSKNTDLKNRIEEREKELEKYQRLLKLDTDFNKICKLILRGENVFITGGAGTGKSYILQHLKENIDDLKNNITSTTGVSAVNVNGVTIHSWAGIGKTDFKYDRVYSKEERKNEINSMAKEKAGYAKKHIKEKIRKTKIIAIDEISMMSDDLFYFLDLYFQEIRQSSKPFGGIQLVLIGDFCQLPPVISDKNDIDKSLHYAFCSESWKNLHLQNIVLNTFHRQKKDIEFAKQLNNLRFGLQIDKAKEFLKDCVITKEQDNIEITHVYQRNEDVKNHNQMCLNKLSTPEVLLESADYFVEPTENNGEIIYQTIIDKNVTEDDYVYKNTDIIEDNTKAAKKLILKVGCKVMIIKNLDVENGIANGTIGIVTGINYDFINIDFENIKNYKIGKKDFIFYNKYKRIYIKRIQFPLTLAYAITIHKSQGLTVEKIVVDIKDYLPISPGQAYVAFSRVKTKDGLNILNRFPEEKIIANKDVCDFYRNLLYERNTNA